MGAKVFVLNIIPRGTFNGTQETMRVQTNALLAAQWPSFADGFIDLTANAAFSSPTAYTNPIYYNADAVHLTALGYQLRIL